MQPSTERTLPAPSDTIQKFSVAPNSRRHRSLQRRRPYERRRDRWIADRRRGMSGAQLATRAATGSLWAYALGPVRFALEAAIGGPHARRIVELCAWLIALERGQDGRVLVSPHRDTARLLRTSPRTTGDAVREAVRLGLIEQRGHFALVQLDGRAVWREMEASYAATDRLRRLALPAPDV